LSAPDGQPARGSNTSAPAASNAIAKSRHVRFSDEAAIGSSSRDCHPDLASIIRYEQPYVEEIVEGNKYVFPPLRRGILERQRNLATSGVKYRSASPEFMTEPIVGRGPQLPRAV
jgi:hypothetical protein